MEGNVEDRISELPEFINHHILSYLDSPKDLVRMSVLSKNWFNLTASFPIFDFNIHCFDRFRKPGIPVAPQYFTEIFFKYVAYTMYRFCKQNVSVHTLNLVTPLKEAKHLDIINRCLDFVLRKGVQVLKIEVIDDWPRYPHKYCLPNTILSASSLTSLTIEDCRLPPSLMVDDVKLKSLKLLKLEYVTIDEEGIKRLTSGCPLLEEITFKCCFGIKRFCVYGLQNLQKVEIEFRDELEWIEIQAPNICRIDLLDMDYKGTPSVNVASCKKLTTMYYYGIPSPTSSDFTFFLSKFPFLETLFLDIPEDYMYNGLKLSSPSLRTFALQKEEIDLENIDIDIPNLLLFNYQGFSDNSGPLVRKTKTPSKACMECWLDDCVDILWIQNLRCFLDKNVRFKELKLHISWCDLINAEDLKVIQRPPFELELVKLETVRIKQLSEYKAVVDAMLWCCRPQCLILKSNFLFTNFEDWIHIIKFTYEKLLQQEDECQTNIEIVFSSLSSKSEKHFSDLNSWLTASPADRRGETITFMKKASKKSGIIE